MPSVLSEDNVTNTMSSGSTETDNMEEPQQQQPLFVMNSLAESQQRFFSSESLEDHNSTTSSTESGQHVPHRKDHEFIPTRMKTISASRPAADPTQFTRVPSNPLLVSAQKQLLKVEEVKKKKEVVKRGDDEPDWQSNLSSWKDKRRKQSEEALQRVAEVKALESDGDESNQRQRISIGHKLSTLMYTNGDDDWSDLGLEKTTSSSDIRNNNNDKNGGKKMAKQVSMPARIGQPVVEEKKSDLEDRTQLVKALSRTPVGGIAVESEGGYGEGVPVLNRKTSAPVFPYGTSKTSQPEVPSIRRKSSELSSAMKSRLEAFTNVQDDAKKNEGLAVQPDETFREKLKNFRKISEPQPEANVPKGPKPPLSYKTLIGSNFSQSNSRTLDNEEENEDEDGDSVDQLLDDALEESYKSVLEDDTEQRTSPGKSADILVRPSSKTPPTEKPPPPPGESAELAKNERNLYHHNYHNKVDEEEIDKQEQEIIASLQKEEREHQKYMETVNAMRNLSPGSGEPLSYDSSSPQSLSSNRGHLMTSPVGSTDSAKLNSKKKTAEKPSVSPSSYNQQHWLIQEAEQRRIAESHMRQQASSPTEQQHGQSPVYENSHYVGGVPINPNIPTNQYTNHQRQYGQQKQVNQHLHVQQPQPMDENVYANLGQQPSNYHRDIVSSSASGMRGLPGPQVPPRNTADGSAQHSGQSDRLLSVSGKKKCSHCKEELGRGAAMIIESLKLFYHLRCFRCVVCHVQLGNGASGTDVRVRNNKLHCQNCYSNDEGLKFSKV